MKKLDYAHEQLLKSLNDYNTGYCNCKKDAIKIIENRLKKLKKYAGSKKILKELLIEIEEL